MLLFFPKGHYHLLNQILIRCTEPNQNALIDQLFTDNSFRKNILVLIVPQINPKKIKYPDEIMALLPILDGTVEKSPTLSGSRVERVCKKKIYEER